MAGKSRDLQKCFEDSQETGTLNIAQRNMKEFPRAVENIDLTDVVRAGWSLSFNKITIIHCLSYMHEVISFR